jgi:hypothetical protein
LSVKRFGVHLSPLAVDQPDIVFGMLEIILCRDPIAGPGGFLGKPFIAGDHLLEIASGALLGGGTVRLVTGTLATEAVRPGWCTGLSHGSASSMVPDAQERVG